MIIANLMGGLGNQMFQYAFGRMLSLKNNVPLALDLDFLNDRSPKENFTYRDYALNVFRIDAMIAGEGDIRPFKENRQRRLLNYTMLFLPFGGYHLYLSEPHFHYFAPAMMAGKNTYVNGYWQSEKYFGKIRDRLLAEFTPFKDLSAEGNSLKKKISQENSVSIHVRRGDYASNVHINKYHGTMEADYYIRAIEYVRVKVENPVLYIFSDHPEWFRQNIKVDLPVNYVSKELKMDDHEEMLLMSSCKHNIIANSSFSWWGAWLNVNPGKVVVAPAKWFNDPSKNTKDLIPPEWKKL